MILAPHEHDALRHVRRAGSLPLAEVGLSTALRLSLAGLARIGPADAQGEQHVSVTSRGKAFDLRDAAA